MEYLTPSGDIVLLDDDVAARLPGRISIGSHGYGQIFANGRVTLLHRWILGLNVGDGRVGDHINRDKLDCRSSNLRVVTPAESNLNRALPARDLPTGVVLDRRNGRYIAQIQRERRRLHLGTFATVEEAHRARLLAQRGDSISPLTA